MLRITTRDDGPRTVIVLEGRLVGPWVDQLEACWSHELATREPGSIQILLADVVFVDAAGRKLLQSIHDRGAQLTAANLLTRVILEEVERSGRRGDKCHS